MTNHVKSGAGKGVRTLDLLVGNEDSVLLRKIRRRVGHPKNKTIQHLICFILLVGLSHSSENKSRNIVITVIRLSRKRSLFWFMNFMASGLRPSSSHNYTLDYVSSNTMIEKDSAGENYMGVLTDTKDLY